VVIIVLLATTRTHVLAEKFEKHRPRAQDEDLVELTNDPLLGRADKISGHGVRGLVAFTFDDGPEPATTPAVIDALLHYNVPATFFIVAKKLVDQRAVEARPILKRVLDAGFLVGSHSVSHKNLKRRSTSLAVEIDDSIRILAKEAARPIGMYRAPFGAMDKRGRAWLKKRGLTEVYWSIDTRDWEAEEPELLRMQILHMIVEDEGGVVLMHDAKPITAEIVAGVLDDLEAENCRRLERNREPILPVSLHYFMRDDKRLRDVPENVKKTTEAYRAALPDRCWARQAIVLFW
jgi:peptidoglycan/xylan/chitin deacetylase (PgdA/CDA1 family)